MSSFKDVTSLVTDVLYNSAQKTGIHQIMLIDKISELKQRENFTVIGLTFCCPKSPEHSEISIFRGDLFTDLYSYGSGLILNHPAIYKPFALNISNNGIFCSGPQYPSLRDILDKDDSDKKALLDKVGVALDDLHNKYNFVHGNLSLDNIKVHKDKIILSDLKYAHYECAGQIFESQLSIFKNVDAIALEKLKQV